MISNYRHRLVSSVKSTIVENDAFHMSNFLPFIDFSNSLFIVYIILLHQGQMIMQDKLEKERADAKNNVEEYVYEMRNKLSGDLAQFMKEEVTKFVLFN